MDVDGATRAPEGIHAVEDEVTCAQLGEHEALSGVADGATDGQGVGGDGQRSEILEGHGTRAEVIGIRAGEGETGIPLEGVGARVGQGHARGVVEGDARAEEERSGTEGRGGADVDGAELDVESARARARARKRERARAGLGDRSSVSHATREGQRGAVEARAVDRPSLDAEGGERSGDRDDAGVGLNLDAVVGAARINGERTADTWSDGEGSDTGRRRREDETVHRQGRVEGGRDGRTDRVGGAEDEGVGDRRDGSRGREAGEVGGPGTRGIPGGAGDAVEVTVDDRARVEHQRGAAGGRGVELVVQASRSAAEDPIREIEAAGGAEERVRTGADGTEPVEVELDRAADHGGGVDDDGVVGTGDEAEVEAEGGAGGQAEDRRAERGHRAVEEVERRAVGDVERGDPARCEAGAEGALRDGDDATVEVDRSGDGDLAEAGLGQVSRARRADGASEIQGREAVDDVDGRAGGADGDVLRRRGADRNRLGTDGDIGERAAVDDDGARAEVGARADGHGAGIDLELAGEAIGARERNEAGRRLDDIDAREDGRDRARLEVEGLGRGQLTGRSGDRAGREDDPVHGLIEGRHVERAAVDSQERGVVEDAARTERQGARGDGGAAIVSIDAREEERTSPDLGQARTDAIDGTGNQDVARAAHREGVRPGDNRGRTSEGQRAGVGLDQRRSCEGDLTIEGVVTAEITERAGATDARTSDRQSLGSDGREAEEFEGRARGDGRGTDCGAERACVRDAERADVDGDGTVKGVRARERELARAVLDQTGRGAGEGAADDEVARTVEGDDVRIRCERTAQGERAGVGLDQRSPTKGDRTAEGIGAAEVAERTGGTDTRAGDGEGFIGDGDTAAQLEGRAVRDEGAAGRIAEGGRVADSQEAGGDRREAGITARAREHDGPGAVEREGARAGDGIRGGVGASAIEDKHRVIDDRAQAERAGVQARADLERAVRDGEGPRETVGSLEDQGARRGLGESAAAVDFSDVAECARLELDVVDRAGGRADREAVEIQRAIGEAQGRGDRGETVARALGDRVADVDRTAGDEQRGVSGAVGVG